ncbi:glycosyltransferase family 2 protein [Streptomyces sp. NPDC005492]|uniref:glycosyltransferase family 2 protein n=1 Tax=Streptomyces sp. NPDC005492 TaxID=3156883 RepID=UPI0033AF74E8
MSPVAVIAVTWNSASVLPGFLAALPDGMAGLDWRLVVADNESADDTVEVLRALAPDATVVRTGRNAGYAAGVNAALTAVDPHDTVLICNPDIRMRQGCAKRLVDRLGEDVGIAVPLLYDEGRNVPHFSLRRESTVLRALGEATIGNRRAGRFPRLSELVTDPAAYERPTRADWATGALMAISANCRAATGPWDESFFLYSEETEYCLRARDLGYATQLEPSAEAVHLGGDSQMSPHLWTLLTLNRVRLYGRRHGRVATLCFRGAVFLREASRAALGRKVSRAAATALLTPGALRATPGPHSNQEV